MTVARGETPERPSGRGCAIDAALDGCTPHYAPLTKHSDLGSGWKPRTLIHKVVTLPVKGPVK